MPRKSESGARTFVKAVLWNVVGLFTMTLVGLVLTGSAAVGGVMALVNTAIGLICYVIYERVWAHVGWGLRD